MRLTRSRPHRFIVLALAVLMAGCARGAGTAPRANAPIDSVVMQVRPPASAARGNSVGQHPDHRVEVAPIKATVGVGPPAQIKQLVFPPFLRRGFRDELLGQDIQGSRRHLNAVQDA